MRSEVPSKSLEWINLILGVGLACAAFMLTDTPVAAWNAGIAGTLVACCSIAALYRYGPWAEWSNLTFGGWAAIAPFVLGFGSEPTSMWTHVIVGICVATIALIQIMVDRAGRNAAS